MRFDLTQASYRVLERASRLRLQRGISAISSAKLLWALFEEDECRAAHWLQESGLSLDQFKITFGIQTLRSPIAAPSFPAGSYGVPAGQYEPPAMTTGLESASAGKDSPPVGNPYPDQLPPDESEHAHQDEQNEPIQDNWEPTKPQKYSLYSRRQQERKSASQSRLQFYLDDQWINIGLFTSELEDTLEMVALRFMRSDRPQSISVSGGVRQIALGTSTFSLSTEHLFFAVVLDTDDVGRWLQENGFEPAELYQRIDILSTTSSPKELKELPEPQFLDCAVDLQSKNYGTVNGFYRLFDAAANRGREAVRVLEDYVRFMLDDAGLTLRLKTFRHQFQNVLNQIPMQFRLAARNTEYDVGTEISAEGEYLRPMVGDLVLANFSRLQESLRSLEEFSKMFDPQTAQKFEQLRYQCYTLQKDVVNQSPLPLWERVREGGNVVPTTPHPNPRTEAEGTKRKNLNNAQLYALIDVRSDEAAFEKFVNEIIAGGVDIIQLRDKHADDRTLLARSRILKDCIAASERDVLFIMNDRPDLAMLAGADGVHVGQDELPAALIRQMSGSLLIGVSTHSIEQARQAIQDGADYIGAGPVFESTTKNFSQLAGLDYLQKVAAEISIPTFAVGGITEDRLNEVLQTGVCRVAVSSVLLTSKNPKETAERILVYVSDSVNTKSEFE